VSEPQDRDGHHDHGALHGEAAPIRVLVVCTGNSARSILAEALLRHLGGDHIEAHSAGTHPGSVNPLSLRILEEAGISTGGLRSKSINEYLGQRFDYVITVCDDARDACPVFPGVHESMHWGLPDPAKAEGTDEERLAAFRSVLTGLGQRIHQFLPLAERYASERKAIELA
jgi:protein-tyrosine-phosphatase